MQIGKKILLCAAALSAFFVGSALAAGESTPGYTTAHDDSAVTYDDTTGQYAVTYTGEDLQKKGQYVLLVVKGTEENYAVGADTILYIDQAAATSSQVTFDKVIPKSVPSCVVLLGGSFTDGTSPKILGTLVSQQATVSGTVKSYDPQNAVTLALYSSGTTTDPVVTGTIPAESGSGQVTQNFTIENVPAGTYDLKVSKTGHTDYWLTGIPVESGDLELQDTITLPCGDVNGDGRINVDDVVDLTRSKNYNKKTEKAADVVCDLNGDGNINVDDLLIMTSSANYNKKEVTVTYGGEE